MVNKALALETLPIKNGYGEFIDRILLISNCDNAHPSIPRNDEMQASMIINFKKKSKPIITMIFLAI